MKSQSVKITVYISPEADKAMRHYGVDEGLNNSETVDKALRQLTKIG